MAVTDEQHLLPLVIDHVISPRAESQASLVTEEVQLYSIEHLYYILRIIVRYQTG